LALANLPSHAALRGEHPDELSIASSPMLRAAMETDAETIRDLVVNEHLFTSAADEVVQLSQIVGGKPTRVVSAPANADALTTGPKLESNRGELRVIASAPIVRQSGGIGGEVTISRPVDLTRLRTRMKSSTIEARLEGLERPIVLVGPSSGTFDAADVSLPLPATPLALIARGRSPVQANPLRAACYATCAAAAILFLAFLFVGMRGRDRDPQLV
jgi:hypothetical protein